jgi:hypothetical protein
MSLATTVPGGLTRLSLIFRAEKADLSELRFQSEFQMPQLIAGREAWNTLTVKGLTLAGGKTWPYVKKRGASPQAGGGSGASGQRSRARTSMGWWLA